MSKPNIFYRFKQVEEREQVKQGYAIGSGDVKK